jgi:peptide deformylase
LDVVRTLSLLQVAGHDGKQQQQAPVTEHSLLTDARYRYILSIIMRLSFSKSTMATFCLVLHPGLAFTATRTARSGRSLTAPRSFAFSSSAAVSQAAVPSFMTQLFSSPPQKEEVDPGVVPGTNLRIVKYPRPALRAENAEITVEELKESTEIATLAKGMLKVMYAAEGVGLAAPQVGINKRLMVYNTSGDSKKWLDETILLNPKIVEYSDAMDTEIEGCLSFPDMSGQVTRSKWIKVQAMSLKGRPIKKKFTGWEARIFQHEYDHLDGVVYIDRLINEEERSKVQPRLDELIAEHGEGGAI